ncbi:MAG: glycosyltransferase [Tepidisphaeraceae bacterium]
MSSSVFPLTAIICTRNPRADILARTLDCLDRQTLAKDQFEVILVDNGSTPPLDANPWMRGRSLSIRTVVETEPGLNFARVAGIGACSGDLMVFVDDDNFLDPDYLENALRITRENPRIGAFGGVARAKVEGDNAPTGWKQRMLPYLGVRDYGGQPITSTDDKWGQWEPIGAGMVIRKDVAEKFVEFMRTHPGAARLDRAGKKLLSGGDSLMARSGYRLGYACSYQPALKFDHFIKRSRLKTRYLCRIMAGHGRSYVILNDTLGHPLPRLSIKELLGRFAYRVKKDGRFGAVGWFWDIGYFLEHRQTCKSPDQQADAPAPAH